MIVKFPTWRFACKSPRTVDQIENMYWDLVYAYENVRVQKEQLAFAQRTLSDTQKQVEIGTLAPIEVVRAQSTVATDQQTLTVALTNLQLQQLLMKNALSRTLVDPALADAEVIPTSTMELPAQEAVMPTQDLVNDALSSSSRTRGAAHQPYQHRDQQQSDSQRSCYPLWTCSPIMEARAGGSAESIEPLRVPRTQPQTVFALGQSSGRLIPIAPTVGYGGTLNQLVNSTAPDKGAGINDQYSTPQPSRAGHAGALGVRIPAGAITHTAD